MKTHLKVLILPMEQKLDSYHDSSLIVQFAVKLLQKQSSVDGNETYLKMMCSHGNDVTSSDTANEFVTYDLIIGDFLNFECTQNVSQFSGPDTTWMLLDLLSCEFGEYLIEILTGECQSEASNAELEEAVKEFRKCAHGSATAIHDHAKVWGMLNETIGITLDSLENVVGILDPSRKEE
jgi:hypothetical protein